MVPEPYDQGLGVAMKISLLSLLCGVCFVTSIGFCDDVGKGPAFVVKISEEAAKEIEAEDGVLNSPVLLDRLQPIVEDIMKASDVRQIFPCRILKSDVVNAFALPAGPVYVTLGMLDFLDSLRDEGSRSVIAGIIGHEIAHVYLRHSVAWARLNNFMKEQPSQIPTDIARILELGYVREQEFEADEYGILYAMRAGYDFESIIKFYKKVRETYGETAPGDEMYADHPRMTERIARLYEVRAQIERDFDQFNYGVAALAEGRYPDAISAFRAFTSTFANSATGWTNLGTAYLFEAIAKVEGPPVRYMITYYEQPKDVLRGKPEELIEAEEAFRRSVEIDTAYNIVYNGNMGIIAALNGEYDRALEFTKKALEGNEGQHFFYNNLGNILFLKESYEDAADAYKKALDLNAYWPLPRYNLALTFEKAGQKELAIDTWKELLDVSGFSGEAVKHLTALDSKFKSPVYGVEPETCLAGVKIGMIEDDVRGLFGEPGNRIVLEKIIALEYDVPGILVFIREKLVSGVLAEGAFQGATAKGIKIGSTVADVQAAYGLPDDIIQQKSDEQWVYGRVGLMVGVSGGYVNGLQLVEANK